MTCVQCKHDKPRGIAYTKGWIILSYTLGAGVAEIEFCSWECIHRYTMDCVAGEFYMLGCKKAAE